jgi:hypothetical protein
LEDDIIQQQGVKNFMAVHMSFDAFLATAHLLSDWGLSLASGKK